MNLIDIMGAVSVYVINIMKRLRFADASRIIKSSWKILFRCVQNIISSAKEEEELGVNVLVIELDSEKKEQWFST